MKRFYIFLAVILSFPLSSAHAQTDSMTESREYAFKASFILDIIKYAEWATIPEGETFNISVMGESPIIEPLQAMIKDRKIGNKQICLNVYEDTTSLGSSQMLFVSTNFYLPIEDIISKYGDNNVLVVTEDKGDADKGAPINLFVSDNKLKFEVNVSAANKAGVKMNPEFVKRADKQIKEARERDFEAVFISHFPEYVEWSTRPEEQDYTIAVLGKSPVTALLRNITKDKKVDNKQIVVKEFDDAASVGPCHILFVSDNFPDPIQDIIPKLTDKHTLIVTEHEGDAEKGADINLLLSKNKLKFEVNHKAVNMAGMKISRELLRHAIIVDNNN